jgi:hypothetical protein
VRRLFRSTSRAPLAVSGLIAVPLYFAALLASSLALDRPRVVGRHEFPGTSGTEAKVWLAALIAPAIVMAVGALGMLVRRGGMYLAAAAGIVVCALLPGISHGWIGRHEHRFPHGVDFIPDGSPSNLSSRGEWEHSAQATITSITHWTIGLAAGVVLVGLALDVRRHRGGRAPVPGPPPAAITGEPEASPVVGDATG